MKLNINLLPRKLEEKAVNKTVLKWLQIGGVILLGGGLDESPQAYKQIAAIVAAQNDLIEIVGKFTPKMVRMAEEAGDI